LKKWRESAQARGRMRVEAVTLDVLGREGLKVPRLLASNLGAQDNPDVEPFFVMEFIEGETLADFISERGKLPLEQAAAFGARTMRTSLCETCRSMREVRTARSRFLLCELSVTNAAYPKYPPQPVVRCDGYQSRSEEDLDRLDERPSQRP